MVVWYGQRALRSDLTKPFLGRPKSSAGTIPDRLLSPLLLLSIGSKQDHEHEQEQEADYPGDGSAPLTDILRTLHSTGGQEILSLEVFNRQYWSQDALVVAKAGLEKMKIVAAKARV
jgi:hypothetical protein